MATARKKVFDPTQVGVYHCFSRTARRGFLCGVDPYTRRDYRHRRKWICDRLQALASVFGIDVLAFNVLENHYHVLLRNRPDVVAEWSDREVVCRWLRLSGKSLELRPTLKEKLIQKVLNNPERVQVLRQRLSHISWFMAMLNEPIARTANAEDGCPGCFWDGRFHCVRMNNETSVLACGVYIDLNQIRAAMVKTPEESVFSSVYARIQDEQLLKSAGQVSQPPSETLSTADDTAPLDPNSAPDAAGSNRPFSGWLAPISEEGDGYAGAAAHRRASDKGLSCLSLEKYLELVDLTGRHFRDDKRGAIPESLAPILERLELKPNDWLDMVESFGKKLKRYLTFATMLVDAHSAENPSPEAHPETTGEGSSSVSANASASA